MPTMKILKGLCSRKWVSTVLYAVYVHPSFTETAIENEKPISEKTVCWKGAKFEREAEFEIIDTVNCIGFVTDIS